MSTRTHGSTGRTDTRSIWCVLPVIFGVLAMHGLAVGHCPADLHNTSVTASFALPADLVHEQAIVGSASNRGSPPATSPSAEAFPRAAASLNLTPSSLLHTGGLNKIGTGQHDESPSTSGLAFCMALLVVVLAAAFRGPRTTGLSPLESIRRILRPPLPAVSRDRTPVRWFTVMRC